MQGRRSGLRVVAVVVVGPAVALAVGHLLDLEGRPGATSLFVLAVLVAAVEAGFWWGMLTAVICELIIASVFVPSSGGLVVDHDFTTTSVAFVVTVVIATWVVRKVAQSRDQAETAVRERDEAFEELEGIQNFTALLSDALTPDDVLAVTVAGARELLEADAEIVLGAAAPNEETRQAPGAVTTSVPLGSSPPLGELRLSFSAASGVPRPSSVKVFADLAGQALERALLFDHEREIANALQRAILPAGLPTVEGASIQAYYEMATDTAEVGGDWYDVLQHEDGRITICVGDISGKGLAAAAEMGRLSKALRIYASEGYTPGQVLQRADRAMMNGTVGEVFATAVCATFDPSDQTLDYACAGHPPPLRVTGAGEVSFLDDCRSTPLSTGVVEAETMTVTLQPGDTVLFYTDGLFERRKRDLDDRLAQLSLVAAKHCADSLSRESLPSLVREMSEELPSEDDTCVVSLSITGIRANTEPNTGSHESIARASINQQLRTRLKGLSVPPLFDWKRSTKDARPNASR